MKRKKRRKVGMKTPKIDIKGDQQLQASKGISGGMLCEDHRDSSESEVGETGRPYRTHTQQLKPTNYNNQQCSLPYVSKIMRIYIYPNELLN